MVPVADRLVYDQRVGLCRRQPKAFATPVAFDDYRQRHADAAEAYDKMFFVWHSGGIGAEQEAANVVAIGPERMARMVLDAGMFNWLKDKVS